MIFGRKKKEEEKTETEVPTEEENDAVQTYMMDPSLQETHDLIQEVLSEAEQVVMGKRPILDLCAVGILAGGNTLFEDNPGLAKTLLANTFAQALGIDFKRVQFTPDLLPADITGSYFYDPEKNKFTFREGPIFCNILLYLPILSYIQIYLALFCNICQYLAIFSYILLYSCI